MLSSFFRANKKARRSTFSGTNTKKNSSLIRTHVFTNTVGTGITPVHACARGLYRRWGITPRPEEIYARIVTYKLGQYNFIVKFIDMGNAHFQQHLLGTIHIFSCIIVWNMWDTDHQAILIPLCYYEFKITNH